MLAGFFTYKVGVLGRSSVAMYREMSGKSAQSTAAVAQRKEDAPSEGAQLVGSAQVDAQRVQAAADQAVKQA